MKSIDPNELKEILLELDSAISMLANSSDSVCDCREGEQCDVCADYHEAWSRIAGIITRLTIQAEFRTSDADLLSRLEKAEQQLKEAEWLILAMRNQHTEAVDLHKRRNAWLAEREASGK
jgi:hypothetical protein